MADRRTALWRFAVPTMSWIRSCAEGCQNTPANPCMTRRAAACHICSVPVRNSTPQPSEAATNKAMPIWMMRRGSKRSASAPDSTEKKRNGSQCESIANPPSAGEWNFWKMIQ